MINLHFDSDRADFPLILVTNDDGIDSPGIAALADALMAFANVVVVAPDRQQSAVGHALTVSSPLRVTPFHRSSFANGFAVSGTPADCVKLAVSTLLPKKPALVVSGINHGSNTSVNILYSGTVSAATEGMMMGVPSIAVSLSSFSWESECSTAAEYAAVVAKWVLQHGLPADTLLNINVPAIPKEQIKGLKITKQGAAYYDDRYERRADPMGREYYWISGEMVLPDNSPDHDDIAVRDGYVSVTPIRYILTNTDFLPSLATLV